MSYLKLDEIVYFRIANQYSTNNVAHINNPHHPPCRHLLRALRDRFTHIYYGCRRLSNGRLPIPGGWKNTRN